MRPKRKILGVLLAAVLLAGFAAAGTLSLAMPGARVNQTAVIAGRVLPDGLVALGADVREGQPLVYVAGIAGPVPTVRANTDGQVVEVLVRPGQMIRSGQVAVVLRAYR